MTDSNFTYIWVVQDRSGSMTACKTETQQGFNAFIAEQRNVPGKCLVTLSQFDDRYEVVYEAKPVAEVPDLELVPRDMTALYDAIGKSINTLGEKLTALPEQERPGLVIVVINTDGHENASHEFTSARVQEMITHQRDTYGWQFVFLGANQDAIASAGALGIAGTHAMTYDIHNANNMYMSTSANIASARSAMAAGASANDAAQSLSYSDDQREQALTSN